MKNTETVNNEKTTFEIPEEYMNDFVKAMKIGYYKELRKNGLLTDEQFMKLIEKQGKVSSVA